MPEIFYLEGPSKGEMREKILTVWYFFLSFFKCHSVCAKKTLISEHGILILIHEWTEIPTSGLSGTLVKNYVLEILLLLLKCLESRVLSCLHALTTSPGPSFQIQIYITSWNINFKKIMPEIISRVEEVHWMTSPIHIKVGPAGWLPSDFTNVI